MSDIISDFLDFTRDLRSLGRSSSNAKGSDGVIRNNRAIIWSVVGLPEDIQIPDLMMRINPSNIEENYQKLINTKRTLGGFIKEHWGDQLDSISASGTTSGFVGEDGLTNLNRRDTDGWHNFESLVEIYRNNGSVYDTKNGRLIAQGSVIMNYDSTIRHGYFESFQIKESAEKPFNLDYEFTFKITYEQAPGRRLSFRDVAVTGARSLSGNLGSGEALKHVTLDLMGD